MFKNLKIIFLKLNYIPSKKLIGHRKLVHSSQQNTNFIDKPHYTYGASKANTITILH